MDIIQENHKNVNNFWLHFYINGEGGEFLDNGLPFPNYHKHYTGKGYAIAWCIDGFFHTKKGTEFLNDTIARFIITFKEYEPRRLAYKPSEYVDTQKILAKTFKLKEISKHLDSIKTHKKAPTRADSFADSTFWAIKLYCEDEIRLTGFVVYSTLERWALDTFLEYKEQSTIRAKCRSVWNYYEERDFKLKEYKRKYTDKENLMSRQDHIKKVHEQRAKETEAKILGAIESLTFLQEKITATKIAEYTKLHRNTVSKFKHLWKK